MIGSTPALLARLARGFALPRPFLGNRHLAALMAIAATLMTAVPSHAQEWPGRQPVKLIAVFPPGGSVDQVARLLAPALQQELGQNVIVDNKGGASGSIGAAQVAASVPDGYTYAVEFDTHGVNPALIPNLPFDSKKDLTTVIVVGTSPMVLATNVASPYQTFADVLAAARKPEGVSFGTIGSGSLGHLAMALLGKNNHLNFVHVPYRGGGPLMNDAVAGHVPLAIGSVFVVKPHIDSRRMRPLAVTTSRRDPSLPDVPTIAESGFAGFDAPAWWAVLAPARTPAPIVRRMNEALNRVLKNPDVARHLSAQGIDILGGTPQAGQAFVERQMDTWAKVVRDNDIKAD